MSRRRHPVPAPPGFRATAPPRERCHECRGAGSVYVREHVPNYGCDAAWGGECTCPAAAGACFACGGTGVRHGRVDGG